MTPTPDQILATVDVTWPAARFVPQGPWLLREGQGGGQRVSSASVQGSVNDADIDLAIGAMRAMNQHPLFMIWPENTALDRLLEKRGFSKKDPVTVLSAPVADLTGDIPPVSATPAWPPLAVQRDIWASAGIGPPRLAVMDRADMPKTSHLGRAGDVPAGTAFTGINGSIAMLHALEVLPDQKRKSVGRHIMIASANWAAAQGADCLMVLVINANTAANAFYKSIGMQNTGVGYHYRRAPEVTT